MASLKKILIILNITLLSLFLLPVNVLCSQEDFYRFPSQTNIPLDKEWKITFNQPIDFSNMAINDDVFIVELGTDQPHPVKITINSNRTELVISPEQPYKSSTEYRIYVNNGIRTFSRPNKYLIQSTTLDFCTGEEGIDQKINEPSESSGVNDKKQEPQNFCTLEPELLEDLQKVSQGLTRVIDSVQSESEKNVARTIKANIDNKIADPCFDQNSEVSHVRDSYRQLTENQKKSLQDAILFNISAQRLIRLADYFGF